MSPRHQPVHLAAISTSLALLTFVAAGATSGPSVLWLGNGAPLVNAGWIAPGLGAAVAVAMLATAWLRRHHDVDLGTVGHHWRAERRLGQGHDSQR